MPSPQRGMKITRTGGGLVWRFSSRLQELPEFDWPLVSSANRARCSPGCFHGGFRDQMTCSAPDTAGRLAPAASFRCPPGHRPGPNHLERSLRADHLRKLISAPHRSAATGDPLAGGGDRAQGGSHEPHTRHSAARSAKEPRPVSGPRRLYRDAPSALGGW